MSFMLYLVRELEKEHKKVCSLKMKMETIVVFKNDRENFPLWMFPSTNYSSAIDKSTKTALSIVRKTYPIITVGIVIFQVKNF